MGIATRRKPKKEKTIRMAGISLAKLEDLGKRLRRAESELQSVTAELNTLRRAVCRDYVDRVMKKENVWTKTYNWQDVLK